MFEHGSTTVPADFPWCGTCRYWNGKKNAGDYPLFSSSTAYMVSESG